MTRRPSAAESARLLRQRLEMGGGEIFLEGLTREEALRLVAAARSAAAEDVMPLAAPAEAQPATIDAPVAISDGPQATARAHPGAAAGRPAPATELGGKPAETPADRAAPLPDEYDALRHEALGCTRCRLCEGRTQVVFSDGPRDARLMVVGEAPGANEDQTGIPFVGAAGQYLDLLLATVGLSRQDSVYIANVLKCRPPGNRDPKPDEVETCSPFLRKQIDLVRPEALLAVGSFSGKLLTGREKVSLGRLRGEVHSYHGVPLVVTYHPAALLRNPRWVLPFWDDLQLLRGVLAGEGRAS